MKYWFVGAYARYILWVDIQEREFHLNDFIKYTFKIGQH